jgi:hypothetical protein
MYKFHEAMEEQKKNVKKEKTREIGERELKKTQVKETEKNTSEFYFILN